MAGLWFKSGFAHEGLNQLVTLTTQADKACAQIHGRMPLIIEADKIDHWFDWSIIRENPTILRVGQAC